MSLEEGQEGHPKICGVPPKSSRNRPPPRGLPYALDASLSVFQIEVLELDFWLLNFWAVDVFPDYCQRFCSRESFGIDYLSDASLSVYRADTLERNLAESLHEDSADALERNLADVLEGSEEMVGSLGRGFDHALGIQGLSDCQLQLHLWTRTSTSIGVVGLST